MKAKILFVRNKYDKDFILDFEVEKDNNEETIREKDILTDLVYSTNFSMVKLLNYEQYLIMERETPEPGIYLLECNVVEDFETLFFMTDTFSFFLIEPIKNVNQY